MKTFRELLIEEIKPILISIRHDESNCANRRHMIDAWKVSLNSKEIGEICSYKSSIGRIEYEFINYSADYGRSGIKSKDEAITLLIGMQ